MKYYLTTISEIIEYSLAGAAKITIHNENTGRGFTFRLKRSRNGKKYWVSVYSTSNNTFHFLGYFQRGGRFKTSKRSSIKPEQLPFLSFEWWLDKIQDGSLVSKFPHIKTFHTGHCARCGKLLRNERYRKIGFGPECLKEENKFCDK